MYARGLYVATFATIVGAATVIASAARAAYPERPIRIIALNPPGGVSDTLARVVGERLAERWGQGVVIDNRAGASGIIGTEIVAKAAPDGYTLLLGFTGNLAINPGLFKKVPYDPVNDFAPVTLIGRSPLVMVAHPSLPAKSVPELIVFAKAQQGKLAYASSGAGNGTHLAMELFSTSGGVRMVHVPYKGGAASLTALIQNEVSIMFGTSTAVLSQINAGRIRAIAVTTEKRLTVLPDVPTFVETGVRDFVVTTWFGVLAPAATPRVIVDKLNAEIHRGLNDEQARLRMDRAGLIPSPSTPEAFAALIKSELPRWAQVIRQSGARPD